MLVDAGDWHWPVCSGGVCTDAAILHEARRTVCLSVRGITLLAGAFPVLWFGTVSPHMQASFECRTKACFLLLPPSVSGAPYHGLAAPWIVLPFRQCLQSTCVCPKWKACSSTLGGILRFDRLCTGHGLCGTSVYFCSTYSHQCPVFCAQ